MYLLRQASKTRPFLSNPIRNPIIMVQNLFDGSKETQRVERKTQKKLAQRRLRAKGVGHAVREKELAIALIDAAMCIHFGHGWESKFTITVRNKQPLGGKE